MELVFDRNFKEKEPLIVVGKKNLFEKIKKDKKCVYLGRSYKILEENYFSDEFYGERFDEILMKIRIKMFEYFKKEEHRLLKMYTKMIRGYKDTQYGLIVSKTQKLFKKDKREAKKFIDRETLRYVKKCMALRRGEEYVREYEKFIVKLYNFVDSLFKAYVYSFGYRRGVDIVVDIFRFGFYYEILKKGFRRGDINKDVFSKKYLMFVFEKFNEKMQGLDIKKFIDTNLKSYKENGWL